MPIDSTAPLSLVPAPEASVSDSVTSAPGASASPAKRVRGKPFEPGNPGGGRLPSDPALKQALAKLCPKALRVMERMLDDPKTPKMAKVRICEYLLDRRLGKPVQALAGADGGALIPSAAAADNPITKLLAAVEARRAAEPSASAEPPIAPQSSSGAATGASTS